MHIENPIADIETTITIEIIMDIIIRTVIAMKMDITIKIETMVAKIMANSMKTKEISKLVEKTVIHLYSQLPRKTKCKDQNTSKRIE